MAELFTPLVLIIESGGHLVNYYKAFQNQSLRFSWEKPTSHEGKVYLAHTLEETAKIAVDLANDVAVKKNYFEALAKPAVPTLPEDKVVKAYIQVVH